MQKYMTAAIAAFTAMMAVEAAADQFRGNKAVPTSPVVENCRQVLEGVQNRYNGYDSWRIVHMRIYDENGDVKTRRIAAAHKNMGINRRLRSLVLDPPELVDVEAYVRDYFEEGKADKVWSYMPSLKKVVDVKSEDLSGRLYGSDLAIGEMLIRQAKDYDCTWLGEGLYRGLPVYKVYVNPRTEAEVIRLGLRDGELWADTETFMPVYSSFNADAPNEQRVLETGEMRWVNGVYAPHTYKVSTIKEGRVISYSEFATEGETFNIGLPTEWFELDDLGNQTSDWREFTTLPVQN